MRVWQLVEVARPQSLVSKSTKVMDTMDAVAQAVNDQSGTIQDTTLVRKLKDAVAQGKVVMQQFEEGGVHVRVTSIGRDKASSERRK